MSELSSPALPMLGDDLARRSALRKMRLVATSLLGVAAIVFAATHGLGGGWGYVNAAAEAAMVGARRAEIRRAGSPTYGGWRGEAPGW